MFFVRNGLPLFPVKMNKIHFFRQYHLTICLFIVN